MKKMDDQKCLEYCIGLFRMMGGWPKWKYRNEWTERVYIGCTCLMFAIQLTYVVILGYGLVFLRKYWETLGEAVEDIIVFATGLIVILKIILILKNQSTLEKLKKYINSDLNKREIRDEEDSSVMAACIKHEKTLTKGYLVLGYSAGMLYVIASIAKIFSSAEKKSYALPLRYPFQTSGIHYYIIFFYQCAVLTLTCHFGTLADSLFSSLAFYICGHFKILKKRISKQGGIITKNFLLYHNEIIRMVRELDSIYGSILVFELTVSSALICLGLLKISQMEKVHFLYYIKYLFYVSVKLSQMFLFCWYGQEIIQQSNSVSYEAYFGSWCDVPDKKFADRVLIVMLRSQKILQIGGGSFIKVCLPTVTTVIHTAYKFFTVLKSF